MYKIKLSPYAKIFYTEWLLDSNSSRYNLCIDQTLYGNLDVERLKSALIKRYIAEHILLNSHIQSIDGEPHWIQNDIINELEYSDTLINNSELSSYVSCGFDLHRGPLYRFKLVRVDDHVYRFITVMHHIIMDGSASLDKGVFDAISTYYNEEDCVAKLSNMEQVKLATDLEITLSTNLEQHKDKYKKFWHEQLVEADNIDINFLRLSDDYSSQNTIESNNSIAEINFSFGEAELAKLNHVKSIYGVTPYGYGQCIFALLLHRYTGHERLAVSYPIAIKEGLDFVYGAQINTNLIPYQFSQTTTIIDLFNQNKGFFKLTMKDEPKHGYYPITDIIQINRNKQLLNICFAQTFFREHPFKFNGITKVETHTELSVDGVAPDMLLFEHDARDNKLNYRVRYDTKSINKELLTNFVESYKKLFSEVLEEVTKRKTASRVSGYNILTAEQYHKIVYEFNKTEAIYPQNKTIHTLFEEQVLKTPNNIAMVYEGTKLTYQELNSRANQLANYLQIEHHIKPDSLVGLCLNRNEQVLISMIGVLKATGAYVPIDPYPGYFTKRVVET